MSVSLPSSEPSLEVSSASSQVLAELVEQVTAGLKAGTADIEAILAAHPKHAAELRRLLPALRLLADSNPDAAPGLAAEQGTHLGQLGDFQLVREVGRGGMGVVYEARQLSLDRRG